MRADRGFHVIKLVDRKIKAPKPLAEVQDDIRMQLRQKEMEKQTKTYLAERARRRWSTFGTSASREGELLARAHRGRSQDPPGFLF